MLRSYMIGTSELSAGVGGRSRGSVCNWRAGNSARSRFQPALGRLKRRLRPRLAALQRDATQTYSAPCCATPVAIRLTRQRSDAVWRRKEGGIMHHFRICAVVLTAVVPAACIGQQPKPSYKGDASASGVLAGRSGKPMGNARVFLGRVEDDQDVLQGTLRLGGLPIA